MGMTNPTKKYKFHIRPLQILRRIWSCCISSTMLTYWQFHALFHLFIKILFNVPSQYLFAIGIMSNIIIKTIGRNIPPWFRLKCRSVLLWRLNLTDFHSNLPRLSRVRAFLLQGSLLLLNTQPSRYWASSDFLMVIPPLLQYLCSLAATSRIPFGFYSWTY